MSGAVLDGALLLGADGVGAPSGRRWPASGAGRGSERHPTIETPAICSPAVTPTRAAGPMVSGQSEPRSYSVAGSNEPGEPSQSGARVVSNLPSTERLAVLLGARGAQVVPTAAETEVGVRSTRRSPARTQPGLSRPGRDRPVEGHITGRGRRWSSQPSVTSRPVSLFVAGLGAERAGGVALGVGEATVRPGRWAPGSTVAVWPVSRSTAASTSTRPWPSSKDVPVVLLGRAGSGS